MPAFSYMALLGRIGTYPTLSAQEKFIMLLPNVRLIYTFLVCIVMFSELISRIKDRGGSSRLFEIGNFTYSF